MRGTARAGLSDLRRELGELPASEAVGVIQEFLDAKQDAPTGLGFVVRGDGALAIVNEWLKDGRFAGRQRETIRRRPEGFVAGGSSSPGR